MKKKLKRNNISFSGNRIIIYLQGTDGSFLWKSPGDFLCGWFCLVQSQGTMNSDTGDTTTKTVIVKTEGERKNWERAQICPARFIRHSGLIVGVTVCDLQLPAETENREREMERKNSVTQTLRCMNSPSRRRAVNTDSPTGPRGHSVCVPSFLRRTLERNYLRWSLWADSFIPGQAHFVCSSRVAPIQENTKREGGRAFSWQGDGVKLRPR